MIDNSSLMSPYGNDPYTIIIEQLYNGSRRFIYSDVAERVVGDLISRTFNLEYHSPTWGYAPGWDYQINGHTIEQKITGQINRIEDIKRNLIALEYARGTNEPAGLLKTNADLFLIISPARSNRLGTVSRRIGKMRLFKTQHLLKYLDMMISKNPEETTDYFIEKGNPNNPSDVSKYILFDSDEIPHYWLGDVRAVTDPSDWPIGYHVENFIDGGDIAKRTFATLGFKKAIEEL